MAVMKVTPSEKIVYIVSPRMAKSVRASFAMIAKLSRCEAGAKIRRCR